MLPAERTPHGAGHPRVTHWRSQWSATIDLATDRTRSASWRTRLRRARAGAAHRRGACAGIPALTAIERVVLQVHARSVATGQSACAHPCGARTATTIGDDRIGHGGVIHRDGVPARALVDPRRARAGACFLERSTEAPAQCARRTSAHGDGRRTRSDRPASERREDADFTRSALHVGMARSKCI